MVGFQTWDAPAEAPAYLSEPGDPWVLVTCLTDYQGDEDLARVAAEALRGEPYRVLPKESSPWSCWDGRSVRQWLFSHEPGP